MDAISLLPVTSSDLPFLQEVYSSTRAAEMVMVPWTVPQKLAFLEMQFNAQHQYYATQFPDAAFQIISAHGEPVGRLYVRRTSEEIRIIDIALLPQHRGAGIGSALLRELLDEGLQTNRPVRISVEKFNPALGLYERLGFRTVGESEVYNQMEWRSLPGWDAAATERDSSSCHNVRSSS